MSIISNLNLQTTTKCSGPGDLVWCRCNSHNVILIGQPAGLSNFQQIGGLVQLAHSRPITGQQQAYSRRKAGQYHAYNRLIPSNLLWYTIVQSVVHEMGSLSENRERNLTLGTNAPLGPLVGISPGDNLQIVRNMSKMTARILRFKRLVQFLNFGPYSKMSAMAISY